MPLQFVPVNPQAAPTASSSETAPKFYQRDAQGNLVPYQSSPQAEVTPGEAMGTSIQMDSGISEENHPLPPGSVRIPQTEDERRQEEFESATLSGMANAAFSGMGSIFGGEKLEGVDYRAGIPSASLRRELSRAGNLAEEHAAFERHGLKEGDDYYYDEHGVPIVTPAGGQKLGTPVTRDTAVDESGISSFDLTSDLRGQAGEIILGTAGALAAPLLLTPAAPAYAVAMAPLLGAGVGAGVGALAEEGLQSAQGTQQQSLEEVGRDVGLATLMGMGGEMAGGTLAAVGRKMAAPYASRLGQLPAQPPNPQAQAAQRPAIPPQFQLLGERVNQPALQTAKQAQRLGAVPKATQVVDAPIMSHQQRFRDEVLGDKYAKINSQAMRQEQDAIMDLVAPFGSGERQMLGRNIVTDIAASRNKFRQQSNALYEAAKEGYGDMPVVPTRRLKESARQLQAGLPTREDTGQVILADPAVANFVNEIENLSPQISVDSMLALRTRLWDLSKSPSNPLTQSVSTRRLRQLYKDASRSIDDAADAFNQIDNSVVASGLQQLKVAQEHYRRGIAKFSDALANRLVREPGSVGSVEPEMVVDALFVPRKPGQWARVTQHLDEPTREQLQGSALDKLFSNIREVPTSHPSATIMDGRQLRKNLDHYGRNMLNTVFGREATQRLYTLSNVSELLAKRGANLGLGPASVKADPINNVGTILNLAGAQFIFNNRIAFRYLTEGYGKGIPSRIIGAAQRLGMQMKMHKKDNEAPGLLEQGYNSFQEQFDALVDSIEREQESDPHEAFRTSPQPSGRLWEPGSRAASAFL